MSIIVNLSATIDYSFDDITAAFVALYSTYDTSLLAYTPLFFQKPINQQWFTFTYEANYSAYIKPYKLGLSDTEGFLDFLCTNICPFIKNKSYDDKKKLLTDAWNAGIKISGEKKGRFALLLEKAKIEPVYLISNTNELHMTAILNLLKTNYPDVKFNENIDITVTADTNPIELAPNIFLCLSYRYGAFKTTIDTKDSGIIERLAAKIPSPITLVSQYIEDKNAAKEVGISNIYDADNYFQGREFGLEHANSI